MRSFSSKVTFDVSAYSPKDMKCLKRRTSRAERGLGEELSRRNRTKPGVLRDRPIGVELVEDVFRLDEDVAGKNGEVSFLSVPWRRIFSRRLGANTLFPATREASRLI